MTLKDKFAHVPLPTQDQINDLARYILLDPDMACESPIPGWLANRRDDHKPLIFLQFTDLDPEPDYTDDFRVAFNNWVQEFFPKHPELRYEGNLYLLYPGNDSFMRYALHLHSETAIRIHQIAIFAK